MKLEDLPPQLRDAATSLESLAGDAYTSARKKFLDALAAHTGDAEKAKRQADELLQQARAKSAGVFGQARAKAEQLLKQAQTETGDLIDKAREKLNKK